MPSAPEYPIATVAALPPRGGPIDRQAQSIGQHDQPGKLEREHPEPSLRASTRASSRRNFAPTSSLMAGPSSGSAP